MMNSQFRPKKTEITGVSELTFPKESGYCDRSASAAKAAERFIKTAGLLRKNGTLGWQLNTDGAGNRYLFAFTCSDAVMAEDFAWIFEKYAAAGTAPAERMEQFRDEYGKVYRIRPASKKTHAAANVSEYFRELFAILDRYETAIRITAEEDGTGTILIGLPTEMPLRMRTMLSFAFPNTEIAEADGCEPGRIDRLPERILIPDMSELLAALAPPEDEIWIEDDEFEPEPCGNPESTFTPIETLDLSVRSYNCLKRAGYDSVEQLRAMKDEDFRRIRNLTFACREEIRMRIALLPEQTVSEQAPPDWFGMLDGLIGLRDVKEQVRKIAAYAKMKRDMEARNVRMDPIALNMEFVGNPGTAKTTVARIMAGVLKEVGLLSSDEPIEAGRADLVARYEGQTADRVRRLFERAEGRLLFIDEAYSLLENNEGEFGDEAISTIVQEMENKRDHTVVIFAGYPDKMKLFFDRNPGLRSRVPFRIVFPDYSADEMMRIVECEAGKRGFSIAPDAKKRIAEICDPKKRSVDSGNGRRCRNLVEQAILSYAERVYGGEDAAKGDFILCERDFFVPEAGDNRRKAGIGFCA